jgi:protein TonB
MRVAASSRNRLVRLVVLSAALHLAITALFMISLRHRNTQVATHAIAYYPVALRFPGGSSAKWTPAPPGRVHHAEKVKQSASDLAVDAKAAPATGHPVSAPESAAAGNGADKESADPAFPVFSPRPTVADRALLPSSNLSVVVDVKVSAAGDVLEATLVRGIGNALDQIVLETVKTWRFHPATLNGSPVATEAELIFPFNMDYPTTPS